jgi:hypothetical protein
MGPYTPEPFQYPFSVPAANSDGTFTIDFLLQQPSRVTRSLANLAAQRFYVDQVFAAAGPITGGAVIYEQLQDNQLYLQRDVGKVQPGDEFPVVTDQRGKVLTAQVDKFGGKFPVTDEARRRNQSGPVVQAITRLANTIVRKTQQRALVELAAAITANNRTATGTSWKAAATVTDANRTGLTGPISDLTMIEQLNEEGELGYDYNYAIMAPTDWRNFRLSVGGDAAQARALLGDSGITGLWITNRKAIGTVYWLSQRMVGELGYEVPLSTETWRDPDGKQQDWYQSYVLPICYVTDPFAILETTGHNT